MEHAPILLQQSHHRHPWYLPWDRVHVDLGEWNKKHFLVVVDSYSK